MTERTIRIYAKELAGEFYEGTRSGRFRAGMDVPVRTLVFNPLKNAAEEVIVTKPFHEAFPDVNAYIKGHWPLFYELARKRLIAMLGDPRVHENTKKAIHTAIKEEREKQLEQEARKVNIPDLIGSASESR
jgi:hypothetical protein